MARVPYVQREDMDMGGKSVYDKMRHDRHSPEVGLHFRALQPGMEKRTESTL